MPSRRQVPEVGWCQVALTTETPVTPTTSVLLHRHRASCKEVSAVGMCRQYIGTSPAADECWLDASMREEELEVALKVVIVGDGGVGKSSMIQRYCRGTFTRDYKKTIGVDFLERQIEIDGEEVRLMLWDTAGQEEFDAITKAYYRGAHACVLAFSTTDRDSFLALHSWKLKVRSNFFFFF
ncbi:unnamed protein product [Plutella xylostella]|uniref:(diamondback moth) hypothetical protein n=1 Tax=Plutella xylostella TaxID=51655 RepID=A0A8S4FG12_PLUXY|nr:unnamed protein product [Plutella xylostella]